MKKWVTRSLFSAATILMVTSAYTYGTGPDPGHTGAPNEETCNHEGCHKNSGADPDEINTPGGSVTLTGTPASYVPGAKYTLSVQVQKPGQKRWGFQLTALKANGSRAGQFTLTDDTKTQLVDAFDATDTSPVYVEHTEDGTAKGQADTGPVWTVDWTAPAAGTGTVNFYAAGNAANGNSTEKGDFIYTTSAKSDEASSTPTVVFGDANGDGKVNVQDATLALQMAVGIITPTAAQITAMDVAPVPGTGVNTGKPFGDGKLNVSDATRILRRSVGLEPDPFPG